MGNILNKLTTTHSLNYYQGEENGAGLFPFKVGTCTGFFRFTMCSVCIVEVTNSKPDNGHIDDVIEWFEYATKNSRRNLIIRCGYNEELLKHLINKGFDEIYTQKGELLIVP